MSMRIRLSEAALLPQLVEHLLAHDCVAQPVDEQTCAIVHVHAQDAAEALIEVLFFLRAWKAQHAAVRAFLYV